MKNLLNKNLPIDSKIIKYIKELLKDKEIQILLRDKKNFPKIYELLYKNSEQLVGYCTILFYNIGIDPLLYMEEIPKDFLSGVEEITQIEIPEHIRTINISAFSHCSNLNKVIFNSNLIAIENLAFSDTSLVNVIVPEGVKYLGPSAFAACNKLEYIYLPSTIENTNSGVFNLGGKNSSLKTIEYAGDKKSFKNIFNSHFLNSKTTIICKDGKLKYNQNKQDWVDID